MDEISLPKLVNVETTKSVLSQKVDKLEIVVTLLLAALRTSRTVDGEEVLAKIPDHTMNMIEQILKGV